MNIGNSNIQPGAGKVDTGRKWIDADGNAHVIYRKTLALDGTTSSLPNATTKEVPHGENLAVNKFVHVADLRADDGGEVAVLGFTGLTVAVDNEKISITSSGNLSTFVRGAVTLEFCLAD